MLCPAQHPGHFPFVTLIAGGYPALGLLNAIKVIKAGSGLVAVLIMPPQQDWSMQVQRLKGDVEHLQKTMQHLEGDAGGLRSQIADLKKQIKVRGGKAHDTVQKVTSTS